MVNLGRFRLIVKREWSTRLKQRSFQITTAIQVLVVLAAALTPILIAAFTGESTDSPSSLVVVDQADAGVAQRLSLFLADNERMIGRIPVTSESDNPDLARTMVDRGEVDHVLIVTRDAGGSLAFSLVSEDGDRSSADVSWIQAAVSSIAMEDRLIQSGLSAQVARQLLVPVPFEVQTATGAQTNEVMSLASNPAEYVIAYFAAILMFIAVVLYGSWIAQGVVEEKSSRVMEIMVNAATPRDLLAGKVIGIMMAGLTQLVPMLLIGALVFGYQERIAGLVGVNIDHVLDINFGALSVRAVGFFLLYFFPGFVLYGALYAGIGSLVSRQEEVNQAIAPLTTLLMVGYFGAFSALGSPDSMLAKGLTIVPMTSPMVAVPRILLGNPTSGEIILSVSLLLLAALVAVWIAGNLYRAGVLMHGQRPGWKRLVRMGSLQKVEK